MADILLRIVRVVLQGGPEDGRSVTLPDRKIEGVFVHSWGAKNAYYRRHEDEDGLASYVYEGPRKVIHHA